MILTIFFLHCSRKEITIILNRNIFPFKNTHHVVGWKSRQRFALFMQIYGLHFLFLNIKYRIFLKTQKENLVICLMKSSVVFENKLPYNKQLIVKSVCYETSFCIWSGFFSVKTLHIFNFFPNVYILFMTALNSSLYC